MVLAKLSMGRVLSTMEEWTWGHNLCLSAGEAVSQESLSGETAAEERGDGCCTPTLASV